MQDSHQEQLGQAQRVADMALRVAKQEHAKELDTVQRRIEDEILDELAARVRPAAHPILLAHVEDLQLCVSDQIPSL